MTVVSKQVVHASLFFGRKLALRVQNELGRGHGLYGLRLRLVQPRRHFHLRPDYMALLRVRAYLGQSPHLRTAINGGSKSCAVEQFFL